MTSPFESLEISPEIQRDEELSRRLQAATRQLQEVVGKSARRLSVKWALIGPDQIRLTLTDSTGRATGDFTANELTPCADELLPGFALRRRFSRLWDELLDIRMEIQLNRIMHPEEDEVAVP